jgi:excinuclease ABC subunit C
MTRSTLDEIPGLGPARRAALLKRFGSLKAMRQASAAEVAEVPGIGPKLAAQILAALQAAGSGAPAAVNLTTGEVLGDDWPVPGSSSK